MKRCAPTFALLSVLALSPSAGAETVAETAAAWGLLGTWSFDCAMPPSEFNTYHTYLAAPGGRLVHLRDAGFQRDASEVLQARQAVGGIDLVVYFLASGQTKQITLQRGPDGRVRSVAETFLSTNESAIWDGKFAATGFDTPWQMRCR